jgi:hypothetical protein
MAWLIAGDLLGVLVLLPLLARALIALEGSLQAINKTVDQIVVECRLIPATLDRVSGLAETQMLTGAGSSGIVRYCEELVPLMRTDANGSLG